MLYDERDDEPEPVKPPQLLTAEELGAELHVRPGLLRKWAADGLVPSYRWGKEWRFDRAAVLAAGVHRASNTGFTTAELAS